MPHGCSCSRRRWGGNSPGGVVAAATASKHTDWHWKTGFKGYLQSLGPDDHLRLAAPIGRNAGVFFFCFEMSPIPQQEASISHVSKKTKTWRSSMPNYTVLPSASQASRARGQARLLLLTECSAFFPSSSVEFIAEGEKGSPSGDSFVVCCATFSKSAWLPDLPFHSHTHPPPHSPNTLMSFTGTTFEGADSHLHT